MHKAWRHKNGFGFPSDLLFFTLRESTSAAFLFLLHLIELSLQHFMAWLYFHTGYPLLVWVNNPVGMWVKRTPVETLLTFCPPAPPERKASILISSSRIYFNSIIQFWHHFTDERGMATFKVESNGEIRTKRWTPFLTWGDP